MQWPVTILTTISVITVFLLSVSEKLLFQVFEAVPLSQFQKDKDHGMKNRFILS